MRPIRGWLPALLCAAFVPLALPPAAEAQAQRPPALRLEPVADGMTAPVRLVEVPDGSGRLLVVDQIGLVHRIDGEGQRADEPFLDVRDRLVRLRAAFDERGLLGLALHPDYAENGRLFVYYSAPRRDEAPRRFDHTSRVVELRVDPDDPDRADPDTERVILEVDQPQFNHNGGDLVFGPDGYLYVGLGDGGGANDTGRGHPPMGNGQDLRTLLGSLLRIDVDAEVEGGARAYAIPADNPFVGRDGRDEIYAYGLRNIWGLSFDTGGEGALFAADVGQNLFEEVNIIEAGSNYGWNLKEGLHGFDPARPGTPAGDGPSEGPRGEPLIDPIFEYRNRRGFPDDPEAYGICVIGGHVYRGEAIPALQGRYVFGDWTRRWGDPDGVLLVASPPAAGGDGLWSVAPLRLEGSPDGALEAYLLGIGRDAQGALYILTSERTGPRGSTGAVHRLVPAS